MTEFSYCLKAGLRVLDDGRRACRHEDQMKWVSSDQCSSCPVTLGSSSYPFWVKTAPPPTQPVTLPCIHRHEQVRETKCELCGEVGKLIPVLRCDVHGECTTRRYKAGQKEKSCVSCDDRLEHHVAPVSMDDSRWSYAVTTTPSRVSSLLPKTLDSMRRAGFPRPLLSADGVVDLEPWKQFNLPLRLRTAREGNFTNWYTTALEVYLRNPFATWYAMFEDDLIMSAGAREYMESTCLSDEEYYHLWTDPRNQKRASKSHTGWIVADQLGRGAVGLVFRRKPFMQLLSDVGMLIHATNLNIDKPERGVPRGKEYVDGMIVTVMKRHAVIEMCHVPSIVQHVGHESSRYKVGRYPDSQCFNGEQYDLRGLLAVQT